MAKKEYVFDHKYDAVTAVEKIKPFLDLLVSKYELKLEQTSPTAFTLTRSGVRADLSVMDNSAKAEVELSFLIEKMVRGPLEEAIETKLRPALQNV